MVRLRIEGSSRIGHLLQPSKRSYTGSVVFAAQRSLSAARETASAHEGITDKATTLARVRCKALLGVIYCSASRDAFPLTVELHRPSADGKVGCNF